MSKQLFEQEQERSLQEIEDNIENINTLIDESAQRQQDLIDASYERIINPTTK